MIAWCAAAWAWTPIDGEALRFRAEWMGLEAGVAEAQTTRVEGAWRTVVASRSAEWLAALYPIDDEVESRWVDGGSRTYRTRYREGRFQQDQRMEFTADGIQVARRQLFAEGWREWSQTLRPEPGVLDPVAALQVLRGHDGGATSLRVYAGGGWVQTVRVVDAGLEVLPGGEARRYELTTHRHGVLDTQLTAWIGTAAARLPLSAVVRTRAGPVTVSLRPEP